MPLREQGICLVGGKGSGKSIAPRALIHWRVELTVSYRDMSLVISSSSTNEAGDTVAS